MRSIFLAPVFPLDGGESVAQAQMLALPKIAIGQSAGARAHLVAMREERQAPLQLQGAFECLTGDDLPGAAVFLSVPEGCEPADLDTFLTQAPMGPGPQLPLQSIAFDS